ncbi:MAG: hypothetical protein QOE88_2046 [Verrucomicrobiota bacterium]|jgi:hypothetical protein|nr:hypothetical protein [Verrucomicrobiota bacterium]MEA3164228.1 hypothetical protein [Verrucomicrobiota bacterium]MEA3204575.1 hypothetical protein [Verrucomicrobiota bacterium]
MLTRALFVCGLQNITSPGPQFEMDAPKNFASILPVNAEIALFSLRDRAGYMKHAKLTRR